MKLYLDNCCYNRPFDDQTQMKIHLETQEPFDYTKWRETHLEENLTVRQLSEQAQEYFKRNV